MIRKVIWTWHEYTVCKNCKDKKNVSKFIYQFKHDMIQKKYKNDTDIRIVKSTYNIYQNLLGFENIWIEILKTQKF